VCACVRVRVCTHTGNRYTHCVCGLATGLDLTRWFFFDILDALPPQHTRSLFSVGSPGHQIIATFVKCLWIVSPSQQSGSHAVVQSPSFVESLRNGRFSASLLTALLLSHYAVDSRSDQADIMEKLSQYCKRPMLALTNGTNVEDFEPFLWDFYNSVFFVITVVSTIGTLHSCRRSVLTLYEIVCDCQTVRRRVCWVY
jgi:hypothetical protein